jgi:hypothetical protein
MNIDVSTSILLRYGQYDCNCQFLLRCVSDLLSLGTKHFSVVSNFLALLRSKRKRASYVDTKTVLPSSVRANKPFVGFSWYALQESFTNTCRYCASIVTIGPVSHSVLKDVNRFVSALLVFLSALLAFPSALLVFLETSGLNSVQNLHVMASVSCEVRTRRAVLYFYWS